MAQHVLQRQDAASLLDEDRCEGMPEPMPAARQRLALCSLQQLRQSCSGVRSDRYDLLRLRTDCAPSLQVVEQCAGNRQRAHLPILRKRLEGAGNGDPLPLQIDVFPT